MPASAEFRDFLLDLLEPLGSVSARRMFGAAGLFYGEVMFAIIADDELFFKVDQASRGDFEAAGAGPFTYRRQGKDAALTSYYRLPEALYDEPDEFLVWARRAVDAALTARADRG